MRKDIIRYSFFTVVLLLIAVFVYPTLYTYDKLEQKYPVKINRITGDSKVLTANGWIDPGQSNAAADELKRYKDEIVNKLAADRESVKSDIIYEIKDQIIAELQAEIEATKIEIEKYKAHELDPSTYFTVGDTKETVRKIMGPPDQIDEYLGRWRYDASFVSFEKGKVTEWNDQSGVLRVK